MSKREIIQKILFLCVVLALVLVVIYSGLRILESTAFSNSSATEPTTASKTIIRNGKSYFPRQDITVVMVLGIDKYGPAVSSQYYKNEGVADMIMLLIFDETNKDCTVLQLNRDTMLEMTALGIRGEKAGTYYGQLALAHTYGTGLEDSCENMRDTLQNFLHGLKVDYYVAMRMDAITILNDAVGGVKVTVVDDFSKVDPTIPMGEVTLRGQQVLSYVQTRKDVGDQKNLTRMNRQKQYIDGFLTALRQKEEENVGFALSAYESVSPYIVTDCSTNTLSGMLDRYSDFALREIVTPEGENVIGDEYYEFYVDEQKLDALILRLFYAEKK